MWSRDADSAAQEASGKRQGSAAARPRDVAQVVASMQASYSPASVKQERSCSELAQM